MEDSERKPNARLLHGEKAFVDAIRNKSWTDLIDEIERGPDFSKDFVQHVLKKQYNYVAAELKKLNSDSDAGANGSRLTMWERLDQDRKKLFQTEKKEDLESKKKILKIYINSVYLIEKAMTLRSWNEVIIEVKNLELFHLPSKFDPHRSKAISTKVRRTSPDVHLCNIPAVSIQHRISYSSNNGLSLHNNHMATLEDRKLVVEISEGDPKLDTVQPKKLGQFVLAMNEIESQCPSDGGWNYREKRSDGFGSIGLRMKRQAANHTYCGSKRQDILHMFKTQLETMERFNSENCTSSVNSSSLKLTPNLRGLCGISLLYAAIEVMADFKLVQKMLSLGADPRKPPSKSPLDLARKQYDRCKSKEQNAGQEFRMACAQKSAEAKRLLDALESAK